MREIAAALILRTASATVAEITAALGAEPSAGVTRGEVRRPSEGGYESGGTSRRFSSRATLSRYFFSKHPRG